MMGYFSHPLTALAQHTQTNTDSGYLQKGLCVCLSTLPAQWNMFSVFIPSGWNVLRIPPGWLIQKVYSKQIIEIMYVLRS